VIVHKYRGSTDTDTDTDSHIHTQENTANGKVGEHRRRERKKER
jgi:hypothetical protein